MSATYATEITTFSWWTTGPRLFEGTAAPGTSVPPLLEAPTVARLLAAALPAAVLALALAWLMTRRPRLLTALAVMTGVALLINPISWAYYFVLMLLPIAAIVRVLAVRGWPKWPTVIALGSLVLLIPIDGQLVDVARALSPGSGLAPLSTLVTLAPGLGVVGICVLLARYDCSHWIPSQRAQA
jgi:hypothetical protein